MAVYVKSQKCKECILPVQTAMCDNFKGWGNFAENFLGITSNVCILHATGNVQLFCAVMRPVMFNCAVFQVSLQHTVHMSSSFPMQPTTTITTLWSIQVKLALINMLREYSACWCNISELAMVMIPPTGVRDSGRAIVVDIVSYIAGMRAATTIWAWK